MASGGVRFRLGSNRLAPRRRLHGVTTEPRSATIEIVAEPHGLLVLFAFAVVSISIDEARGSFRLATHAFAVTPGTHNVAVGLDMGLVFWARATVSVEAGESVRGHYRLRVLGGRLEVELPIARVHR